MICTECYDEIWPSIRDRDEEIADLKAKLAAAEKDAERYRWLRDDAYHSDPENGCAWAVFGSHHGDAVPCHGTELDEAVDAAIAKEKE